jgi:hypothetical protein
MKPEDELRGEKVWQFPLRRVKWRAAMFLVRGTLMVMNGHLRIRLLTPQNYLPARDCDQIPTLIGESFGDDLYEDILAVKQKRHIVQRLLSLGLTNSANWPPCQILMRGVPQNVPYAPSRCRQYGLFPKYSLLDQLGEFC